MFIQFKNLLIAQKDILAKEKRKIRIKENQLKKSIKSKTTYESLWALETFICCLLRKIWEKIEQTKINTKGLLKKKKIKIQTIWRLIVHNSLKAARWKNQRF